MTRAKRAGMLLSLLLTVCMMLALMPMTALAATPAEADQGFSVRCEDNRFIISRTDTSGPATVTYRTVSQSAVAGIHFTANSGTLSFNAGEPSKIVSVSELRASATADFFYQAGATRTYGFEVLASDNRVLASCQRVMNNSSELELSAGLYGEKSATVFTDETSVTDSGYNQRAAHSIPLNNAYTNGERSYFSLIGARLRMAVDLEVKEADDGYQHILITTNPSAYPTDNSNGNPGSIGQSTYLAAFAHEPGIKNTAYAKYSFPVTSAGDNCAEIASAWNYSPYNNSVGKLYTQKFAASARATDDGRIILPDNPSWLGIRFDAAGDNEDDWYARNVIARLQAVDGTAPTVTGAYVTNGVYGYRDTVTIALRFSEVVKVTWSNKLYLNTNFGTFSYGGGSGTNVLYFSRQMTDNMSAKSSLQITGINLSGCYVEDLKGNDFTNSAYTASFSGVSYEGSYGVTVDYNDGSSSPYTSRYRLNSTYTFPAAGTYQSYAPAGHEFDCYKVGETAYAPGDTVELTGNITVTLQWKPLVYTVRFVNWDGEELQSGDVTHGDMPAYAGEETPSRPADARYTYAFAGWTPQIAAATGDITYTATYSSTVNEYTVTFLNEDGSLLQTDSIAYGETPAYNGEPLSKAPTASQVFTFAGWTPQIAPVTGAATYTAVFTATTRSYTVTFEDYDGTLLQSGPVPYGETPAYAGDPPVRTDEGETRYTFAGWTPEISAVSGDATYTAVYTTTRLYPVTLPEYVEADKTLAAPGETVTLTVTAPDAYNAALTYTPQGGEAVAIPEAEGAYAFAMPAAPVTVGAEFSLPWLALQNMLGEGGTVTLLCDVTAGPSDNYLGISSGNVVTLDLNGHTIDRALTSATPNGYVIWVNGGLTLTDSSVDGAGRITGGNSSEGGGGVYVRGSGTFIMEGGTISGNAGYLGGGVYFAGGTFTMTGGTITNNTASSGGGVYNRGLFAMTGGTITNNTASYDGGGVYVREDGTFSASGSPVVSGNLSGGAANNVYLSSGKTIALAAPLTQGASIGVTMQDNTGVFTSGWADNMGTADPADFFTSDDSAYGVYEYMEDACLKPIYSVTVAEGIAHGTVTADKAVAAEGETVSLTVIPEAGFALTSLTVMQGEGEVTVENDQFTMPAGDVTVTATFAMTWDSLDDALRTGGEVVLQNDITADAADRYLTVPKGVTVTLDLKGHTLSRGLTEAVIDGCVIRVNGSLTLTDNSADGTGRITGGNNIGNGGGVVVNGTFTMTGGAITGNTATNRGGGVYVNTNGTFTMTGGAITNNSATWGGGVYATGETFAMTGGAITGNSASSGGGVYNNGTFAMTGGAITGNTGSWGGGVYVVAGPFSISGSPVVSDNQYAGAANDVYLSTGKTITLSAPLTQGTSLGVKMEDGTGVFTDGWTAVMGAADPADYFYSDNNLGIGLLDGEATVGVFHAVTVSDGIAHGAVKVDRAPALEGSVVNLTVTPDIGYVLDTLTVMQGETAVSVVNNRFNMPAGDVTVTATFRMTWDSLGDAMMQGASITLPYDITAGPSDGALVVPSGVTATLNLNGHTLDRALTEAVSDGFVVQVAGSLTLTDGSADGTGRITGGKNSGNGGGVFVDGSFTMEGGAISGNSANNGGVYINSGMFTMTGGTITDNTAGSNGGGVFVNSGTFTMTGGAISHNTATTFSGGGVFLSGSGTFVLEDGAITGNSAQDAGGVYTNGTFSMTGGAISGNTATIRYGGGVALRSGSFSLTGGTITNNVAGSSSYGGGVHMYQGTFSVSGSPVVSGNVSGSTADNVYLSTGKTITLSGELTDGASIGVTMQGNTGVFTTGWADNMGTADPADFFTGDDAHCEVYSSDDEAALRRLYDVTVAEDIAHGTVTADMSRAVEGGTVTLTVIPEAGFALTSLTVTQGETEVAVANNQFTMPAGDVTVTATFEMTWDSLNSALYTGGPITLPYDITAGPGDSFLQVPSGANVTLDLNGHTLSRGLAEAVNDGYVIEVNGSLTLTDSSADGTGRITGGNNNGKGGGVYINSGTFTITGGAITDNTASWGGGVYVYSGTFTMTGGTISGNIASEEGGGVYVIGNGMFSMTGGTITGNTASGDGGGVYVYDGMFSMTGGAITGNTADSNGGGVYLYRGWFEVSGSPVITGNLQGGAASNVYLRRDKKITLSGKLTDGASIGVTMADNTGVFTSGWATRMGAADPAAYFTSDSAGCAVSLSGSNAILTEAQHTVTFIEEDGTVLQAVTMNYGETPAYTGQTPSRDSTEQYDYTFSGWSPEIAPVTGDATYTARFTETVRQYTVCWQASHGTTLKTEVLAYGDMPSYTGETPTTSPDSQYTYTFNGNWDPEIAPVTGDVTYTAQYDHTVNEYTVTWLDGDGNILKTERLPYGTTSDAYTGDTPTRTADAWYTYTFNGEWDGPWFVSEDTTYTARFDSENQRYSLTLAPAEHVVIVAKNILGELITEPIAWDDGVNLIITVDQGYQLTGLSYTPEGGEAEILDYWFDDEDACYYSGFTMPAANATVTATAVPIPTLALGENTVPFVAGIERKYLFTPAEDGYYRITTTGKHDFEPGISGVADEEGNWLYSVDSAWDDDDNLCIIYALEGGTTYTVRFNAWDGSGDCTVFVDRVEENIHVAGDMFTGANIHVNGFNAIYLGCAATGDSVKIGLWSRLGYELDYDAMTLTLDSDGSAVPFTVDRENEVLSFTMPEGAVTLRLSSVARAYPTLTLGENRITDENGLMYAFTPAESAEYWCYVNGYLPVYTARDNGVYTQQKRDPDTEACYWSMNLAAGNTYYFDFQYSDISESVYLVKKSEVDSWTITVDPDMAHGSVFTSAKSAFAGEYITLFELPEEGYRLAALNVTQADGTSVYVYAGFGGRFSFTMPTRNVTVSAVFVPIFGAPDLTLPTFLTAVEEEAFEGIAASVVLVPDGCASIGDHAFRNCPNLTQIRIPANCALGTGVFDGCAKVYVYGASGSAAEAYCQSHANCVFVADEEEPEGWELEEGELEIL